MMSTAHDPRLGQAAAALAAGNPAVAEQLCREILEHTPRHAGALHISAHARRGRGDGAGARDFLSRVLEIDPHNLQAMEELGAAEFEAGHFPQSESWLRRAIALGRGGAAALCWLGLSLSSQGRHPEAVEAFRQATAAEPRDPGMHLNLGHELTKTRSWEQAIASYDRTLAIRPDDTDALYNRGNAFLGLYRLEEALASYDRALAVMPGHAEALNNRGIALLDLNRYEEVVATYRRLLDVAPDYPYMHGYLLHAQLHCCDWAEFESNAGQVVAEARAEKRAATPFNFIAISESAADQLECARLFVADEFPAALQPQWHGERYRHDRIRVAYLSADLHNHAVPFLIAGLFEAHDRARFEIVAVSLGPERQDEMRARLIAAFDRFIDARENSDREVAERLREMEIDIAVDLQGFTKGCRPGIFALRPAPVQVNYLGYPGTMGAGYMDYILGDQHVIPAEHYASYSEKVVWLPDCYQVNDAKRRIAERAPTRAELGLPEGAFVFCCFNNNYKITPRVFDVWMRLLGRIDGSVLWLLEDNPAAARNLRGEAELRNVASNRLVFAPRVKMEDHLARQRLADLFLDTLPYNAHVTASDALWAGLPLVTRIGDTFAGRVAASLLNAVGMPELITTTWEEYERLALELAGNRERLAAVKAKLASNRAAYPLFDTDRFRRYIEAAYVTMWERVQRGEPPASFAVARED